MLEEIQITGDIFFPIGWLGSSFSGHSNMEAFNMADKFLKDRPDYPEHLRLKVLQNTDQIKRAAEVKKKYFE
jgi:aminopeptidase N